jgi:hypothetical protein
MSSATAARSVVSMTWTASSGSPALDSLVRVNSLRAAAQYRRISRLQAKPGGVGGDVRARLVDDANNSEGDPHASHAYTRRPILEVGHLTYRIRECGDLAQSFRHRGDAPRRQL